MAHRFERRSLVRRKDDHDRVMWVADNNEDGPWGEDQVNCEWRDEDGRLQTKLLPADELEALPPASR